MRFSSYSIVLQEVPGEITLSFSITGCKLMCKGCHSPFLWKEGSGQELTKNIFEETIQQYNDMITCILFMGGEWHEKELIEFLKMARAKCLKTCLYTGLDNVSSDIIKELDFLKTGRWVSELGGLDKDTTNQKFINVHTGEVLNNLFVK